jgi:hypothetical protein
MVTETLKRIQYLCDTIPGKLRKISEQEFSLKPSAAVWSKKEILGHLIDSASNNHQRFVRVQFEDLPTIFYDQNKWNRSSRYNAMTAQHLISFWEIFNRHLCEIAKRIPETDLQRKCRTDNEKTVTLQWLIDDYVVHLEHHLHQLLEYE